MSEVQNGKRNAQNEQPAGVKASDNSAAVRDMCMKMVQESQLIHNIKGLTPSATVYNIIPSDLEKIIFEMSSKMLKGIDCVTLEIIRERGVPCPVAYVWLPKDSEHLVDKTANEPGMVISPRVRAYSEQLKRFADNFAPDRDENGKKIDRTRRIQTIQPRFGNTNLIAVRCDINKFLARLFDSDNLSFRDTFAKNNSHIAVRPVELECRLIAPKSEMPTDIRDVQCIRVIKKYADGKSGMRNRPVVGAFQAKRRDDDD